MTVSDIGPFSAELASKAPTPGGGGASAAVGALAAALGQMVCNLTVGKARYAQFEEANVARLAELEALRVEFLELVQADADAFAPVSAAYAVPKDDPARPEIMEAALRCAVVPPLKMAAAAARTIDVLAELVDETSVLAMSDIAVGAVFASAALEGAALNVYVNTSAMTDAEDAARINAQVEAMMPALQKAQVLTARVRLRLMREGE